MGLFRTLKSIVDTETMGEEIVLNIEKRYRDNKSLSPGDEPIDTLMKTFIGRMQARGFDIDNREIFIKAFTVCYNFSCLREGRNARALALWCLSDERPDIVSKNPKFSRAFQEVIYPIEIASTNQEKIDLLFRTYNPYKAAELEI